MAILFLLGFISLELLIIFLQKYKVAESFVFTYLIMSSFIFVMSSVLSIYSLWNYRTLVVAYLGTSVILLSIILTLFKRKREEVIRFFSIPLKGRVSLFLNRVDSIDYIVFGTIILAVIGACIRGLGYPPTNTDSITYHIPRAFYYYKMQRVDNYPTIMSLADYGAPGSGILMSHVFIIFRGNDLFLNLYQLPSAICIFISSYYISLELGLKRRTSQIIALLIFCTPLVILESASTQTDLLTASFVVISVHILLLCIKRNSQHLFILLGLALGTAVNTKITAGVVLLPIVFAFAIFMIAKHKQKGLLSLGVIGASSLPIVLPFWIRNYLDLNGDFLALGVSSMLEGDIELGFVDYLGRIILNLGYCIGGKIHAANYVVLFVLRIIYNKLGAVECKDFSHFKVYGIANHDYTPYGIVLLVSLLLSIWAIFSRKTNLLQKVYSAVSFLCILFVSVELPVYQFVPSVTRYILMAVCLNIVVIGFYVDTISKKRIKSIILGGIVLYAIMNVVLINYYDSFQSLKNINNMTYADKRDYRWEPTSWRKTKGDFKDIIDKNGFYNIGIYEEAGAAIYPMLQVLASNRYNVRSVYGKWGEKYDDINFSPDVLIYTNELEELPDYLVYHNENYVLYFEGGRQPYDLGTAALYVREQ